MRKVIVFCLGVFCVISVAWAEDEYTSSLNTPNQERYYPSKIRFAAQASTEHRGSFYVDYLFPVWYAADENSLIFFNPKQTIHTNSSDELNLGVGYRKIFWDTFVGGVHFFYDQKNSPNEVKHSQVGWGLELLSEPIDLRFNYYDPTSGIKVVDENYSFGSTRLLVSHSYEEPLEGFDFEVGVPIEAINTRAYAGGFFYDSKIANDVEGYRLRTETDINNWLSLDLEMNSKNKQEIEFVGGLRVTVPLEFGKLLDRKESIHRLLDVFQVTQRSKLKERLLERVVRDIDIKTTAQTTAPVPSTNTDVQEIIYVDNSNTGAEDGTRDNPWDTLAEALADGRLVSGVTIYVSNGDGTATGYTGNFILPDGILLWGSGYNGGYSGIPAPGYPILDGGGGGIEIIALGDNNTVMGLELQNNAAAAILGLNTTGANITCNYIHDMTGGGGPGQPIALLYTAAGSYSNQVRNNRLTYSGGNNAAIFIFDSAGATSSDIVADNYIYDNNASGISLWCTAGAGQLDAVVSGNTIVSPANNGIYLISNGGLMNVTISQNNVLQPAGSGISFLHSGIGVGRGHLIISDNIIDGGNGIGIEFDMSALSDDEITARIERNRITTNGQDGIKITTSASDTINIDLGRGSLNSEGNNSIYGYTDYAIDNGDVTTVSAEDNWWGTDSPAAGQFNGLVDYTPWLTSNPN